MNGKLVHVVGRIVVTAGIVGALALFGTATASAQSQSPAGNGWGFSNSIQLDGNGWG